MPRKAQRCSLYDSSMHARYRSCCVSRLTPLPTMSSGPTTRRVSCELEGRSFGRSQRVRGVAQRKEATWARLVRDGP